jgi:hypothetical protein
MDARTRRKSVVLFIAAISLFAASLHGDTAPQQPDMKGALDQLLQAHSIIAKSPPDTGGHQAKALRLTRQAIDEVKKSIASRNRQ